MIMAWGASYFALVFSEYQLLGKSFLSLDFTHVKAENFDPYELHFSWLRTKIFFSRWRILPKETLKIKQIRMNGKLFTVICVNAFIFYYTDLCFGHKSFLHIQILVLEIQVDLDF